VHKKRTSAVAEQNIPSSRQKGIPSQAVAYRVQAFQERGPDRKNLNRDRYIRRYRGYII